MSRKQGKQAEYTGQQKKEAKEDTARKASAGTRRKQSTRMRKKQARKAILACVFLAMVFMGSLGVVMMFAGDTLTAIISTEPIHLQLVPQLLFIAGVTQTGFAVMMVIRQALKGVGDTVWTFLITSFSSWCIRLPAVWYLGVYLDLGLVGIWYALCGEMILRAFFFILRYRQRGWVKRI